MVSARPSSRPPWSPARPRPAAIAAPRASGRPDAAGAHGVGRRGSACRGAASADGLTVTTWVWLAPGAARRTPCPRRQLGRTAATAGHSSSTPTGSRASRSPPAGSATVRSPSAAVDTRCVGVAGPIRPRRGATSAIGDHRRRIRSEPLGERGRAGGPGDAPGPLMFAAELRGDSTPDASRRQAGGAGGAAGREGSASWSPGRSARAAAARWSTGAPVSTDGCFNGPLRGVTGRLERRRTRLAGRGRSVRRDAFPLRRDRRSRLGADPRARAPGRAGERRLRWRCRRGTRTRSPSPCAAPAAEPAANVVLLPTFTYLAYSCERDPPGTRVAPGGPLGRARTVCAASTTATTTAAASTRRRRGVP